MMTKKFAVFGQPVRHSLSPQIHQDFAAQCGIALSYERIETTPEQFAAVVTDFFQAGGYGANITLPFKETSFRLFQTNAAQSAPAEELTARTAALISHSANTLYWQQRTQPGELSQLRLANTDGHGLVTDLTSNLGWELKAKKVLLVGAGGAARGIIPELGRAIGDGQLYIINRTAARATALVQHYAAANLTTAWPAAAHLKQPLKHLSRAELAAADASPGPDSPYYFDLIINCTAWGLAGDAGQDYLVPPQLMHEQLHCYDLFYNQQGDTPFVSWARQHQAAALADGLGMLVEQAAASFNIWHAPSEQLNTQGLISSLRQAPRH